MILFRSFHPTLYQGIRGGRPYFEGWYFKHSLEAAGPSRRARSFAVIPGISRSSSGDEAFVQTIDGTTNETRYFRFPLDAFSWKDRPFGVSIAGNTFSLSGIRARLEDRRGALDLDLSYEGLLPLKPHFPWPGIMGPYSLVPFMECNHGIVSLDHRVAGRVTATAPDGSIESRDFGGGKGYIEKDWGSSMPTSWIWMHANNFAPSGSRTSFAMSVARVPWLGRSFTGFFCVLHDGADQRLFSNYTGAKLEMLEVRSSSVRILLGDEGAKLEILARTAAGGELVAPRAGAMDRRIGESLDATVRVVLKQRYTGSEDAIFDGTSILAGLETVGDIGELRPRP